MDNNDVKILIDSFKEYRDMLTPIQKNLYDFTSTYDAMRDNVDRLNQAFGGDIRDKLETIYQTLSSQAQKAQDLSSRIDRFVGMADKYTSDVSSLLNIFSKVEQRLSAVNSIETQAEVLLAKLDIIVEEKSKGYSIKDLQRSLENYNNNVQKVSEFINKDISESLIQNQRKLESIKDGVDDVVKKQRGDSTSLDKLLEEYTTLKSTVKAICEKDDVNEVYLYEILDRWAEDRKLKVKK